MSTDELMTPEMREEIQERELEQKGGVMGMMQEYRNRDVQNKSHRLATERLNKSIRKRNTNRIKNKRARQARSKQR